MPFPLSMKVLVMVKECSEMNGMKSEKNNREIKMIMMMYGSMGEIQDGNHSDSRRDSAL